MFQVLDAVMLKAWDTMVFFILGTANMILSEEGKFLIGVELITSTNR